MSEKSEETKKKRPLDYLKAVTVEPTMFLYMLTYMLTSVVEQTFFVHKACTVDLGFPEEVCLNLTHYEDINKQVQVVVSTFHQNNDIVSHVIPVLLALFMGAWSDKRGRKLLLLIGLTGKLWYWVWIVINSLQEKWSLQEIMWTASLPSSFFGTDLAVFSASFAYISDITTPDTRTLRITVLDVTYLTAMPLGVALGKYLFAYFNRSFTSMFALNVFLLSIALLYSFFRLNWITTSRQVPLKLVFCTLSDKSNLSENAQNASDRCSNCFLDFFDKHHFVESVKTITRRRPHHGRFHLILLILSLGLYTFQRDERQMSYLYTNLKFNWKMEEFSDFRIFQSGIYIAGMLLCVPLMGKLHLRDTSMILTGTSSHILGRVVFALANKPWLFYLGACFTSLGPITAPILRSLVTKIVSEEERGKGLAILSVADTTVPLVSGAIYSQVYNATIHTYPEAIFWVTVATQLFVFIVALIIKFSKNVPSETSIEQSHEQ